MPPVSTFEADRWLDRDDSPAGRGRSFRGLVGPALEAPRRFLRFARTSPGKLSIVSTILVIAILAAGGAMVISSESRQDQLNGLVSRTEPLSNASQELFNSLSVADSVATTSFLQKNTGDYSSVAAYHEAMQDASSAVIRATSGIDDPDSREMHLVIKIQTALPEYVQLISNAQTNDRLRNPVGASYLSQGSALMQETMLPAAEELYQRTSKRVSDQQSRLVTPMWFPLSGLVAAVIMLILAQFWLAAMTNRRLNVGYLTATGLMVFALLWTSVSSVMLWNAGNQNVQESVQPLESLTQARIQVQQARTQEALGLIERDYDSERQAAFSDTMASLDSTLDDLRGTVGSPERIDAAREAVLQWDKAHSIMVSQLQNGRYSEALNTALATTTDAEGGTRSFDTLDRQLSAMIDDTRKDLRNLLVEGRTAAGRVANLVLLLTVISALCVVLGTRPRLQEFL
ncbi:MAG TPA: hypothetical protein H9867_04745 [Candidatus Corynebacterium gallistercoris]|uniref:Chemotaxis methyl-accepting receptor HlyB-like 4HB MCP domain-containing protein n=1 Tax=Candidatus Corynebacterium gallistercoris TaxID=2838530 RepID=A0A9D1UR81_9CORY|nr:hypothetical protein [Candidatus Corynebacterium gallistercoris]